MSMYVAAFVCIHVCAYIEIYVYIYIYMHVYLVSQVVAYLYVSSPSISCPELPRLASDCVPLSDDPVQAGIDPLLIVVPGDLYPINRKGSNKNSIDLRLWDYSDYQLY